MAALSQSRALAGSRAMRLTAKPSVKSVKLTNGSDKWSMKRKDSYMVEIEVADDETEDQAVKRYMKAVVQSGVINQLRARRRKETKIEEYKRKLQDRAQARRLGIVEPTWEEFYGLEEESRPFEEYFRHGEYMDDAIFIGEPMPNLGFSVDSYTNLGFDNFSNFPGQGGYIAAPAAGGYMDQQQGGYMGQQQGGYMGQQQGAYMDQQTDYSVQPGGYVQEQNSEGEQMYRFDQEPQQ